MGANIVQERKKPAAEAELNLNAAAREYSQAAQLGGKKIIGPGSGETPKKIQKELDFAQARFRKAVQFTLSALNIESEENREKVERIAHSLLRAENLRIHADSYFGSPGLTQTIYLDFSENKMGIDSSIRIAV